MSSQNKRERIVSDITNNCLAVRLRVANRYINGIYDHALRKHGLKASQINILVAVASMGEAANSASVCSVLKMDVSTFSRSVSILKRLGLLHAESSGDGKILKVVLTESGYKKLEELHDDWLRAQRQVQTELGVDAVEGIMKIGNKCMRT